MSAGAVSGRGRVRTRSVTALFLALGVPGSVPGAAPGFPPDETRPAVSEIAGAGATEAPEEKPLEELIIELRAGRIARQTIIAAFDGEEVLIPARPLFELVEIRSSIDAEGCLRAVRQPDGSELYVDAQLGTARVGTLALPHEQVHVRRSGAEIYLGAALITGLFGVRVEVDMAELTVTLDPADQLPVGRRVARERARTARHGGGASAIPDRVVAEDPAPFGGAAADWLVALPDVATPAASSYALRLGARVLSGGLDLRHSGGVESPSDFAASWIGTWPEHWGWRQLRLGSVLGTGPAPRAIQGIAVSSSPFIRPLAFSESEVTGWLAPGWEVELYRNGELVDFTYADERGFYLLRTSTDYGENPLELRAYGPNGEVRELSRSLPVAADRLPHGECEYEATFGACDGEECDQVANLDVRYGVSERWTVRAGTEAFNRPGSDLLHPYGILSGLVREHWLVRAEGTAGARGGLELGYVPTPDLRVGAGYQRFDTGTMNPILTMPGQRSQTRWTLFYRPDSRHAGTFITAGGQQQMAEHGSHLRLNAAFASQLRNLRWSVEWREERAASNALRGTGAADFRSTRLAVNASTGLHSPVPILNSLYVRGTAELEARAGGLERLSVLLGRSLGPSVRAELTSGWVKSEGGLGFSLAISATGSGVHSVGRVTQRADGRNATSAFAEGSVLWNESAERVEVSTGRTIGRGGVSGTVFIDENANGWLDPAEPRLPGVKVIVGSQAVRTDALGRYSAWDLAAFEAAEVAIDPESMPSPLLVPSAALAAVAVQPNGFRAVDLPVLRGVELMGRVLRAGSSGETGLGSVRVTLRERTSGRVHETLTFSNGEFYLMGLPAGEYAVSIPADVLELLDLALVDEEMTLHVPRASERLSQLPDLTIRLRKAVPAPAVE
jgi:hypothetical protein